MSLSIFRGVVYARVSSRSQNENRQVDALKSYGCRQRDILVDKASGKNFRRPEYEKLKSLLQPGDEVVILDLDRLGRNYQEMATEWNYITKEKQCDITILNCPILSTKQSANNLDTKLIADITFQLLSYVAERERLTIIERQKEGIASAKNRGVSFGRPRIQKPVSFDEVYKSVLIGEITNVEAMKKLDLKPNESCKRHYGRDKEGT